MRERSRIEPIPEPKCIDSNLIKGIGEVVIGVIRKTASTFRGVVNELSVGLGYEQAQELPKTNNDILEQ
jgi:hypothetical protein